MNLITQTYRNLDDGEQNEFRLLYWIDFGKTKGRSIAVNIIGQCQKLDIAEELKSHHFCICVDESTDITTTKTLVIDICYNEFRKNGMLTKHWGLFFVYQRGQMADCSSERLLKLIEESFIKYKIPFDNVFATSADGCSAMTGVILGLKGLLQLKNKKMLFMIFGAHKVSLIIQHSVGSSKIIPPQVLNFIQNAPGLDSHSSKRSHDLKYFQEKLDQKQQKMLKYMQVRWSSLFQCNRRTLENWSSLMDLADELGKYFFLCLVQKYSHSMLCHDSVAVDIWLCFCYFQSFVI